MQKYGLLGKKLGHSLSSFIHNILFEINGVTAEYSLYETEDVKGFLRENHLDGMNVTIPYKKDVFELCKSVHSSAQNLGVVNCVDSNLVGYNTDVYGYRKSVSEIESSFDAKVLLLGCGGAGQMIAKQYNTKNLWIAIRNVTEERVSSITKQFPNVDVVDIANIPNIKFDLICNSTSVGMYPDIESSPISKDVVAQTKAVYDVIYNPLNTKLLQMAENAGKKCKNGLDMLVLQAVKSHYYWYGGKAEDSDIAEIIRLAKKELEVKC